MFHMWLLRALPSSLRVSIHPPRRHLITLFVLSLLVGASAQQPGTLIDEGRFLEAYQLAVQDPSDASLSIIAARAASLYATYHASSPAEQAHWFKQAIAAAERAEALAPNNPESLFELARARGSLANHQGVLENLNLAGTLRSLLERTLLLAPDHADAMMALARLQFELANRGVGWLYGASREQGASLLNEALALEPTRINFRNEAAIILLQVGSIDQARAQLSYALSLPASSAIDRLELERARHMLAGLDAEQE